jgi:hypothetical protein
VELFFKAVVLQLLRYLLLREGLAEIGSVLPATANLTRLLLLSFFFKKNYLYYSGRDQACFKNPGGALCRVKFLPLCCNEALIIPSSIEIITKRRMWERSIAVLGRRGVMYIPSYEKSLLPMHSLLARNMPQITRTE